MEKIHENVGFHAFMYKTYVSCIFAYFSPHDIMAEKGPLFADVMCA